MTCPPSDSGPETDPRSLVAARENLCLALEPHPIDLGALERAIRGYVAKLKAEGAAPEAVIVAVKRILGTAPPPLDGDATRKAFELARNSYAVQDAIVGLAIASYYGDA